MSGRSKTFLGVAFVALVFFGFNAYMRGIFEDRTGLDLPAFALPIKYETGSARGDKTSIAFWTLPGMAKGVVGQRVFWAGEGTWSNAKVNVWFHPVRKKLRGNELTFGDPDYWHIYDPASVGEDGYIKRGKLVLVKTGSGFIYLIDYK